MADAAPNPPATDTAATVDAAEIARFSAQADGWWDTEGSFRPLHKLNPPRLAFIRDRICGHYGRDPLAPGPLAGLTVLDVGCGGGLIAEPLARLGARVTGLDASHENIAVARAHAVAGGLDIAYGAETVEALAAESSRYDVVLALEVVEHVADLETFLAACCAVTRPGGALVLSTLNRTAKAFLLGIIGAEYVLRWVPRGTHRWRKFVRPSELAAGLRAHGAGVSDIAGLSFDMMRDEWRLGRDVSVNYMMFATRDQLHASSRGSHGIG